MAVALSTTFCASAKDAWASLAADAAELAFAASSAAEAAVIT